MTVHTTTSNDHPALTIEPSFGNDLGVRPGPASRLFVQQAADLVDRSGVAEMATAWVTEDHPRARPPRLPMRTLLIGWLAVTFEGRSLRSMEVAESLNLWMPQSAAVPGTGPSTRQVSQGQVTAATKRMLASIDYSTRRPGYACTHEDGSTMAPAVELEMKRRRNLHFFNALLRVQHESLGMPAGSREVSVLIDAHFREACTPSEPGARPYMRGGMPEAQLPPRFGWEYQLATLVSDDPMSPDAVPPIVIGMAGHKPGSFASAAHEVFDDIVGRGRTLGYVIADRAYNSVKPELHDHLRNHGAKLVLDYTQNQLGVQSVSEDAILVEGLWYSPLMPEALRNALSQQPREVRRTMVDPVVRAVLSARKQFEVSAPTNPDAAARRLTQHHAYLSDDWQRVWHNGRSAGESMSCTLRNMFDSLNASRSDLRGEAAHGFITMLGIVAVNAHRISKWETTRDSANDHKASAN